MYVHVHTYIRTYIYTCIHNDALHVGYMCVGLNDIYLVLVLNKYNTLSVSIRSTIDKHKRLSNQ